MNDSTPTFPAQRDCAISVAIVSKGRPEVLDETIAGLFRQTRLPRQVIVVVPAEVDLPRRHWGDAVQTIVGPLGICNQRNKAIEAIPLSVEYVAFFDDDYELKPDYLEEAVLFLQRNPATIAFSGQTLVDGGITRDEAIGLLAQRGHEETRSGVYGWNGKYRALYGCNMIIRRSILEYEKFDEALPLYAFAEDYDISIRLERYGNVGRFSRCLGVHLATPGGRVREVQRGYSFVSNPWYFHQKGVSHLSPFMTLVRFWLAVFGRTFLYTLWKVIIFDKAHDWPGRLKGIWLAFVDIVRGKSHPKRILEL